MYEYASLEVIDAHDRFFFFLLVLSLNIDF